MRRSIIRRRAQWKRTQMQLCVFGLFMGVCGVMLLALGDIIGGPENSATWLLLGISLTTNGMVVESIRDIRMLRGQIRRLKRTAAGGGCVVAATTAKETGAGGG